MVDSESVLRAFLVAQPGLFALAGQRVYAGSDLPAGYKPSDGGAIIFTLRGGEQDYSSKVLHPSYAFRCYAKDEGSVRALSRALYDNLNDKQGGKIKFARLESLPALLSDPAVGWPFMLAFYRIIISNN